MKIRTLAALAAAAIAIPFNIARAERPYGWGGGPSNYSVTLNREIKLGGQSSVLLQRTGGPGEPEFGTVVQVIDAEKFVGRRVRLRGYLKSEGVEDYAGLWMRVDSEQRGTVAFDNMQSRPVRGTSDWYRYDVVLDVPEDAASITFGLLLQGPGKLWGDDLSLEPVGEDIDLTSTPRAPTGRGIDVPDDLPAEPSNLSFEPKRGRG